MANELNIRLVLDGNQFRAEMRNSAGEVQTFAAQTKKSAGEAGSALDGVAGKVGGAIKAVAALAGISIGIGLVKQVASMADSWSDLTSRVRLSIGANDDAADVMDRLSSVARGTYSSIEATAEGFTRNSVTLRALGKSTQEVLDYTEAMNNALVVSGAKGQAFESVQSALSKAMATGALRGDELNTVLNSGSRIAQVLAEELGTNVIGLRALGEDGKITGEVIYESLVKNMQALGEEAASMPATIGDAFVLLRNAVLQSVGVFDQQAKVSESFAEKLILIADHMDDIIRTAFALGKALAVIYGTRLLMQAAAFTAELVAQGIAYARNITLAGAMAAANGAGFAASLKSIGLLNAGIGALGAAVAGWQIGTYLRDEFLEVRLFGIAMINGLLKAWQTLKAGAELAWEGIKAASQITFDAILEGMAMVLRQAARMSDIELFGKKVLGSTSQNLGALADAMSNALTPGKDLAEAAARISAELEKSKAAIDATTGEMADWEIAQAALTAATEEHQEAITAATTATIAHGAAAEAAEETDQRAAAAKQAMAEATRQAAEAARTAFDAENALHRLVAEQAAQLGGPAAEAALRYADELARIAAMEASILALGPLTLENEQAIAAARDNAAKLYQRDMDNMEGSAKRAAEEAAQAWSQFADDLAATMLDGSDSVRDYFHALLDDLLRMILSSGIKAAFAGMFDGKGAADGFMGAFKSAFGNSAGGGNNIFGQMFSSWINGGGAQSASQYWATMAPTGVAAANTAAQYNAALASGAGATSGGASAGAGGMTGVASVPVIGWIVAAVMSNIMAANNGWRGSGGSLDLPNGERIHGGGLGYSDIARASPLLGVHTITAIVSKTADSLLTKLGLGEKAAAILSGSAVLTKLFGRKAPRLEGVSQTLGLGGVASSEAYDIYEKGGLFSSSRHYTRNAAATQDTLKAAQALFDTLHTVMTDAARSLKDAVAPMFAGALKVVHDYEKDGTTIKATKYFVQALGRSWEEATEEAAMQRLSGEAFIAQIDHALAAQLEHAALPATEAAADAWVAQADKAIRTKMIRLDPIDGDDGGGNRGADAIMGEASRIAERWRDGAAKLADGATFLLAAATDIRNGTGLLGEGGSLTAIANFVEELQFGAESLTETYARLAGSAQLLDAALGLSGVVLDGTREAFVRFAAGITDAAGGLERASALWGGFFERFYTDIERAQFAQAQAATHAATQFSDIGLNAADFTSEGGLQAFRTLFETALPQLSADAVAQWLEAAEALGLVIDAQADYAAALQHSAQQAAAVRDVLDANAAELAKDGMTQYQLSLIEVGKQFDAQAALMLANAATAEDIARHEAQRAAMLAQTEAYFAAERSKILGEMTAEMAPLEGMAAVLADIAKQAETYRAALVQTGMAAEEAAAQAQAYSEAMIAQAQARNQEIVDGILGGLRQDAALAGMTELERALAQAAQRYTEAATAAQAAGATEAELAEIRALGTAEADRIMAAEAQRLAAANTALADWANDLAAANANLSDYASAMREAGKWRTQETARATELARAAGLATARVEDLAAIELRHAQMAAQAMRQLQQSTRDLITELYGTPLSSIEDQIAILEAQTSTSLDTINDGIDAAFQNWQNNIQTLQDWLNGSLVGDLSPLSYQDQVAELWEQLQAAAESGDAQSATQLADQYLALIRAGDASGQDWNDQFWMVRELIQGMMTAAPELPTGTGGSTVNAELQALYAQRDAMLAEQEATHRLELATQLRDYLTELAAAVGTPILELAESLGIDIRAFVTDLGVNLDDMTIATTQQLAAVAGSLGVTLFDLAESVDATVGTLANQYSLAAGALAADIGTIPGETGDALKTYLEAIYSAEDAASADAATQAMATYIGTLAPDIVSLMAPYFGDLIPEPAPPVDPMLGLAQSQYSAMLDTIALSQAANTTAALQLTAIESTNALLSRVAMNLATSNEAAGIPSYAVGTYRVPQTGPAILHEGEMVLPRPMAQAMREGNFGGDGNAVVAELRSVARSLAEKLDKLERAADRNGEKVSAAMGKTGIEQAREFDKSLTRNLRENQRQGAKA